MSPPPSSSSSASPPSSAGVDSERIWYSDLPGFFREDRLARIVPQPGTPLPQQLNAVMRFALYYGVLVTLYQRSATGLFAPLLASAVTYVIYANDQGDAGKMRERMQALQVERDPVTQDMRVSPTRDNPFMNVLVSDYARFPNRPPAADITRTDVSRRAENDYEHDLYRDQSDVFNRNASSRQWYTTPSTTIPNDQTQFARWLYGTSPTCKEGNGDACNARAFRMLPDT